MSEGDWALVTGLLLLALIGMAVNAVMACIDLSRAYRAMGATDGDWFFQMLVRAMWILGFVGIYVFYEGVAGIALLAHIALPNWSRELAGPANILVAIIAISPPVYLRDTIKRERQKVIAQRRRERKGGDV